ncbi:hypothetical protein ATN83_p20048 (plasmid) [Raoultella ornithinolytica]|uniref:Uncharacterized protein n=1 Tax=Raoultella ornithinolytica TaxID=54291 RepID=A0A7U1DZ03_RAOOR|nr:hypothetical protein ATN83_p20048 [Raoultella ornithinolytica]QQZ45111.1 hypothetical protein [Raoultella ornithinolytica]QZX60498.1 hypothetical protein [Klebsiella michiganensis]
MREREIQSVTGIIGWYIRTTVVFPLRYRRFRSGISQPEQG